MTTPSARPERPSLDQLMEMARKRAHAEALWMVQPDGGGPHRMALEATDEALRVALSDLIEREKTLTEQRDGWRQQYVYASEENATFVDRLTREQLSPEHDEQLTVLMTAM